MTAWLKLSAVAALTLVLGLHWALLQTLAWSGMVVRYAQVDSFQTALEKTFDGNHPCGLCRLVKAGRSQEESSRTVLSARPVDLWVPTSPWVTLVEKKAEPRPVLADEHSPTRSDPPAFPPPRWT